MARGQGRHARRLGSNPHLNPHRRDMGPGASRASLQGSASSAWRRRGTTACGGGRDPGLGHAPRTLSGHTLRVTVEPRVFVDGDLTRLALEPAEQRGKAHGARRPGLADGRAPGRRRGDLRARCRDRTSRGHADPDLRDLRAGRTGLSAVPAGDSASARRWSRGSSRCTTARSRPSATAPAREVIPRASPRSSPRRGRAPDVRSGPSGRRVRPGSGRRRQRGLRGKPRGASGNGRPRGPDGA